MTLHPALTRSRVTVDGAAALTGLSTSTLNKLRLTGGGSPYLKLGRRVLYDVSDLEAWMSSKRRRSTSEAPSPMDPPHGRVAPVDAAVGGRRSVSTASDESPGA